jgi:hypothetical protein
MKDIIRVSPESFETIFETDENGEIVLDENGNRIVVERIIPPGWKPVRVYEYEKQLNENKREIFVIDKIYRNQIVEEFRKSIADNQ